MEVKKLKEWDCSFERGTVLKPCYLKEDVQKAVKEKIITEAVKLAKCKSWEDIPSGLCFSKKQIEKLSEAL